MKKKFCVAITVLTGLHIGNGNDNVQIGGVDSAVMKDPVSKLPYIPGSSLKGKLRSLLETEAVDKVTKDEVNLLFGFTTEYLIEKKISIKNNSETEDFKITPTRLIFRDLFIPKEQQNDWFTGIIQTEVKAEVSINRITGSASSFGPRFIERVPPGTVFAGEILFRYISNDNFNDEFERAVNILKIARDLLKNDALGGSGSRGYGAVDIEIWNEKDAEI